MSLWSSSSNLLSSLHSVDKRSFEEECIALISSCIFFSFNEDEPETNNKPSNSTMAPAKLNSWGKKGIQVCRLESTETFKLKNQDLSHD